MRPGGRPSAQQHHGNGTRSPWPVGLGLVAVAGLASVTLHIAPLDTVASGMPAPWLTAWSWQLGGPKLLVRATALCGLGDPRQIGIDQRSPSAAPAATPRTRS